jgi:hypothetical protein
MRCNVPANRCGSTKRPSKRQLRQLRKRAVVIGARHNAGLHRFDDRCPEKRRTHFDSRSWPVAGVSRGAAALVLSPSQRRIQTVGRGASKLQSGSPAVSSMAKSWR